MELLAIMGIEFTSRRTHLMKMVSGILVFVFCLNLEGVYPMAAQQIATDLSLQSGAQIAIKFPHVGGDKKFQIQFGGLRAEKPPEVLFSVSLRCKTRKVEYHLGYLNFFNATGKVSREPTFTFNLPDLEHASCPVDDFYLSIQAEGDVAPGSLPHIKYVNLLHDGRVISAPRE